MKIYAKTTNRTNELDRFIGTDLWFAVISKTNPNHIFSWNHITGKTEVGGKIYYTENVLFDNDYYTMPHLTKDERISLLKDTLRGTLIHYPDSACTDYFSEIMTTAELFNLDEEDLEKYS